MGTTKASVSLEDYLSMSFDGPDAEYVAGEIVERNVGEGPHSQVQTRLIELFYELRKRHRLYARAELRLRLNSETCRIPDVSVFVTKPEELVPTTPPMITIEIVSRDDRYSEISQKLTEYLNWGVAHIWLVDPWKRQLHVFSDEGLTAVRAFELPELGVQIPLAEIFAD